MALILCAHGLMHDKREIRERATALATARILTDWHGRFSLHTREPTLAVSWRALDHTLTSTTRVPHS